MKRFVLYPLAILAALLIITGSCERNSEEIGGIRPLPYLSAEDIPVFRGMSQIRYGENPRMVTRDFTGDYTAEFEYLWESDSGDYSVIDIRVIESQESAIAALLESHKYYSNPFIEENRDEPAVVGDLSYFGGVEFIRDNLIIKIRTSDNYDNSITEIARSVDNKILKGPAFHSLARVKPVIKEFSITDNPVLERTQTLLVIRTEDPNNQEITYQWRFDKSSGYGGIYKDGIGNYFYSSGWADTSDVALGLTLIAINRYGFCKDSTIYISTIKE